MSTALTPVAMKLGKLIRMLGSPMDGEVVSAARILDRTLRSVGADLHLLADRIENEPKPIVVYRNEPDAPVRSWQQVAYFCVKYDRGRLSTKERTFVTQMKNRLVMDGRPSAKQADWLRDIYARLKA